MGVLQQEYSQPPILPSPHFRWVVKEQIYMYNGLQKMKCFSCKEVVFYALFSFAFSRQQILLTMHLQHIILTTTKMKTVIKTKRIRSTISTW